MILDTLAHSHLAHAPVQPQPLVSVVVVNFNGRFHLNNCLGSLLATNSPEVEIIFVDNHSSDGSAEYVADRFPEVQLLQRTVNDGYGSGNNSAAEVARGEYLVILNPDTVVTPGWWELLVDALNSDPTVGMTTPKILLLDQPERINTAGNDIHISGLTLCRGMGESAESLTEMVEVTAVSGAAFAIRRDLFLALGGFDADFFMYMEDSDLSLRVQLAGYRCLVVPESVIYHDYALRIGPDKLYFQERNRYLMLLKTWRWRTLFLLLPTLVLTEMITWAFVLLQDRPRWRNKLKAYRAVWQQRSAIRVKRQQVQANRRISDRELLQRLPYRLSFEQAGESAATRAAHRLFDPLFWLMSWALCRIVVW